MRILIIGANGLLGSDLVRDWTENDIIPATSRDADIRDAGQVRHLVTREHPDWIILAAAYTDVDGSERDPDLAFAVNRDGARNVSVMARELGAKLCYVSTDYVFDGTSNRPYEPEDPVHPLNVYGASKVAGEQAVQEQIGRCLIVRTSWLFGAARPCFPEKILASADSLPELKVVTDQIGSPTYTRDLYKRPRRRHWRTGANGRARHSAYLKLGNLFPVRICKRNSAKSGPGHSPSSDPLPRGQPPRQAPRLFRSVSERVGLPGHYDAELARIPGSLSQRTTNERKTSLGIFPSSVR
jgi:hypothetical protein